jgi:hypothetical protein
MSDTDTDNGNGDTLPDPTIAGPTTPTPEQRDAQDEDKKTRAAKEAIQGSVQSVKEWVGGDKSRARSALDAENDSDSPRKTLVTWLEKHGASS